MGTIQQNIDFINQTYSAKPGPSLLPPKSLRSKVHGNDDPDSFLNVGQRCSKDVEIALQGINRHIGSFQNILDFGCGCGRVLRWFREYSKSSNFYGTDIDFNSISWCRQNLDFAKFSINQPLPPLKYPDRFFDMIYAVSVFTHVDETYQFRWLNELKRIVKPKGILILTVHGRYCWESLPYEHILEIEEKGFMFVKLEKIKSQFPEWYQTAYHSKGYVVKNFTKYFKLLNYLPRAMNDHQDLILLQND